MNTMQCPQYGTENQADVRFSHHLFKLCWGLLALFLLAGCATVEQEVSLYQDESWEGSTRIGVAPGLLAMAGGEEALTAELEQTKVEADAQGAKVEWRRSQGNDGTVYYAVEASGQGYDLLNQIVFDGDAIIEPIVYDGQDAVQFQHETNTDLASYEMRLHAGEILESDGLQEGKGDVTWQGAGVTMNAVLRPKSSFPLLPAVIGVATLVLIIAAVLFYQAWRRQQARRMAMTPGSPESFSAPAPAPVSEVAVFCEQCGKRIEVAGKFCPHCGAPRF